jgi:thiaminase
MAAPADKSHHPEIYRRWLEYYEKPEQGEFSTDLVRLFEESATLLGEQELAVAEMVFVRSLQHQIAVFDAAWETRDEW